MSRSLRTPSRANAGFTYITNDTISVDIDHFEAFVRSLWKELSRSNHRILQSQLRPVILPGVVMLKRAGRMLESLNGDDIAKEVEILERAMPQ